LMTMKSGAIDCDCLGNVVVGMRAGIRTKKRQVPRRF